MKKLIVAGFLTLICISAYAQNCPQADQILVSQGGKYELRVPSGWVLDDASRSPYSHPEFSVAAWGDHIHTSNFVRCHYYQGSNHISLSSDRLYSNNEIISHPNWGGNNKYHLCSSGSVYDCQFG